MRYKVVLNKKFDGTIKNSKYAKIVDTKNNSVIAEAYYDPRCFYYFGSPMSAGPKDGRLEVVFDSRYLRYFTDRPNMFEPLMMHEIGHYLHGDAKKRDVDAERRARREIASKGEVSQMELDADRFAASQVGKKALRETLSYIVHDCIKLGVPHSNPGIKELEQRIKELK